MLRTIYGFDDLGRKVPTGKYDDGIHLPVGGKIFYILPNSDEVVKFYDSNGNIIKNVSVGDSPYSYDIINPGTAGAPKYYVYNDTVGIVDTRAWGYYRIPTGATENSYGGGKVNTEKVMKNPDGTGYVNTSIFWSVCKPANDESVGGCNDWYVPCRAEIGALIYSGLVSFSGKNVWSSEEYSSTSARYYNSGTESYNHKGYYYSTVLIRSF